MPTLCLTTPGTRVQLVSERLRIEVPAEDADEPVVRDLPLADIERLVISEHCGLTMPALGEMLRREIPVIITQGGSGILGMCLPPAPPSTARLAHYRAFGDAAFVLAMAANFVEAKILNCRRVLQRLAANREDASVESCLQSLTHLAAQCSRSQSLDELRGYEGTSAGKYFEAYGRFFPETAPFERRSRRPPHNAPNAILSFTYTLLASEAEAELHAIGLDPAIGFLHEPTDRRASLALDLIEPFRAPVADAMALDLLSHGTLHPHKHFQSQNGGIYLNTEGKKRLFVAYERRMEREFTSEQHGRRTTLRRELQNQALGLKQAVLDGIPFLPFLMN
jgi:CRISPR-associated endonuclease Cas1